MNPDPTLESLGLPPYKDAETTEESWKPFEEKIAQMDSEELQKLESDVYKQAAQYAGPPKNTATASTENPMRMWAFMKFTMCLQQTSRHAGGRTLRRHLHNAPWRASRSWI